ncbi:unnamed protein product [Mytilus coruscus]|uniref:G-protein coupled receptors family 2 profile 1 domain-containing protein n=1 Tax=Mytilus coruscus TaxID=42192 RepID=A0A6J8DM78_MYTCO|nr:unnamed protein product [Mytilus coruscus]
MDNFHTNWSITAESTLAILACTGEYTGNASRYCSSDGKWKEPNYSNCIIGAVRARRNSQTGFSANMMMLGREIFQPLDVILGTSNWNADRKEVPQYIKDLVENLKKVHDIARDNLKASQERQKGIYDLKYNQNIYNVGDVVCKLNQATKVGQSGKLKSPWKGPYLTIFNSLAITCTIQD